MTTYAEARTACHLPPLEVQFNSIVAGLLFAEQRLDGSIVDAGAREGHNACFYAVIAPTRTVHAIEPIRANYRIINKLYSGRSNLRPMLAGLGSAHGAIDLVGGRPGAMLDKKKMETLRASPATSKNPIPVYTIDELFHAVGGAAAPGFDASEKLGFFHLDVEGLELDVLQGARRVLERDRPVLSTEAHVSETAFRESVHRFLAPWYATYMVDEVCGTRWDCRNFLHLPRSRLEQYRGSPTLDLALASGALVAGNASDFVAHARAHRKTVSRRRDLHFAGEVGARFLKNS